MTVTELLKIKVTSCDYKSDLNADIRVNHLGFMRLAPKNAVLEAEGEFLFRLRETKSDSIIKEKLICSEKGDLGSSAVFDFSDITAEGTYYITADKYRSFPFSISDSVWDEALISPLYYFSKQRCGASETGYMSPCHLEDGIRMDTGEYQCVSGGWHDASDLRKWVGATIYGMIGIGRLYQLCGDPVKAGGIFDELEWGNRYFLAMQEPDGSIMSHVGGDVFEHSDSNHWTDNLQGTDDDRVIKTTKADIATHFRFIEAQALTARAAIDIGKFDYALTCRKAAEKCAEYIASIPDKVHGAAVLSDGIKAFTQMHRVFGDEKYTEPAVSLARGLIALQPHGSPIRGFFMSDPGSCEPYRDIYGCAAGIALCDIIEEFPDHNEVLLWKDALRLFCEDYLLPFVAKNGFGIVPYGLHTSDLGGSRKYGEYYLRYFMALHEPTSGLEKDSWWVGVNAHLSGSGITLLRAASILKNPGLCAASQRQLDWILGCNPFDDCHMDLLGRNNHTAFHAHTFYPSTPRIKGAVLNGLGGSENDMPDQHDASYHTCEYWTPMVCHTMWLLALMRNTYGSK